MITLSNKQGLMFAQITTEQTKDSTALGGWFGAQQAGQAKALVTDTVNSCRGVVTHTVGEAILSSFPDAQLAVKAALELQRRLAKSQSPTAGVRTQVRIGVAFGPVRVMAGKVSGDAVTAAGLLLEKAKPGEILVDQAVKDEIARLPDIKLAAHGSIENVSAFRIAAGPAAPDLAATTSVPPRPDLAATKEVPRPKPAAAPPPPPPPPAPPPAATQPRPAPAAPAPKPAPRPAGPLVLHFNNQEKSFTVQDGEIELGRALENHVVVPVVHVSRKHAKIVWEGQVPYVVNLSQNGTCVKFDGSTRQHPVNDKVRLQGNGQIALAGHFGLAPNNEDVVRFSFG
jgi:hypothetical protein